MNVVVAYQSPTLFNILAASQEWNMYMSPMGDHDGLRETSLIDVPIWRADAHPSPDLVLVCTPAHLHAAKERFPGATRLWVIHNGRERHLLSPEHEKEVAGALVFSRMVQWLQGRRSVPVHWVSPAYEADPIWSWAPKELWTMRNRPDTRSDDLDAVIGAICEGLHLKVFGQGQPAGFATPKTRRKMMSSCSGYVAALHRSAGFGLSQHECLAAGVPIIGGWWGDLREEMSPEYWGLQDSLRDMAAAARMVCENPDAARHMSRLGVEYIRRYRTRERMDETIRELISHL